MSTIIDPFGEIPSEDRARAEKIYGALRREMDQWIEKRVEALGKHVAAEADAEAKTVVAQAEIALRLSIDETERRAKEIRELLQLLAKPGLGPDELKTTSDNLEKTAKALEADVQKQREEMKKWGENMAAVAAKAAKAAIKLA